MPRFVAIVVAIVAGLGALLDTPVRSYAIAPARHDEGPLNPFDYTCYWMKLEIVFVDHETPAVVQADIVKLLGHRGRLTHAEYGDDASSSREPKTPQHVTPIQIPSDYVKQIPEPPPPDASWMPFAHAIAIFGLGFAGGAGTTFAARGRRLRRKRECELPTQKNLEVPGGTSSAVSSATDRNVDGFTDVRRFLEELSNDAVDRLAGTIVEHLTSINSGEIEFSTDGDLWNVRLNPYGTQHSREAVSSLIDVIGIHRKHINNLNKDAAVGGLPVGDQTAIEIKLKEHDARIEGARREIRRNLGELIIAIDRPIGKVPLGQAIGQ
jgi:hypothetical protein